MEPLPAFYWKIDNWRQHFNPTMQQRRRPGWKLPAATFAGVYFITRRRQSLAQKQNNTRLSERLQKLPAPAICHILKGKERKRELSSIQRPRSRQKKRKE